MSVGVGYSLGALEFQAGGKKMSEKSIPAFYLLGKYELYKTDRVALSTGLSYMVSGKRLHEFLTDIFMYYDLWSWGTYPAKVKESLTGYYNCDYLELPLLGEIYFINNPDNSLSLNLMASLQFQSVNVSYAFIQTYFRKNSYGIWRKTSKEETYRGNIE